VTLEVGERYASVDGDADRLIYFYKRQGRRADGRQDDVRGTAR